MLGTITQPVSTIFTTTTITLAYPPTFTPQPSCFDFKTFTLTPIGNDSLISTEGIATPTVWIGTHTECYPRGGGRQGHLETTGITQFISSASPPIERVIVNSTESFFSNSQCPPGFEGAHTNSDNVNRVVTCCPSGMSLTRYSLNDQRQSITICAQQVEGPATFLNSTQALTVPTGSMFEVWDFPQRVGLPLGRVLPSTAETATPGSSMSMVAPTSPSNASAGSGLSTGAQTGIGVGAAIAGILLLALAFFLLQRRRQHLKAGKYTRRDSSKDSEFGKAELPGHSKPLTEMGYNEIVEASAEAKSPTTPADVPETAEARVELEGDWACSEVPANDSKRAPRVELG